MPKLTTIVVGHTTSNEDAANSPSDFTLEFVKKSGTQPKKFSFRENLLVHSPQSDGQEEKPEREKGQLDLYRFDVSDAKVNSDDPGFRIVMRIKTSDGCDIQLTKLGDASLSGLEH